MRPAKLGKHSRRGGYAWIDIRSGPAEYGPASSGNGFVSEGSLPSPGQGLSLPAAIASTVWRTVQHLFLPVPSSLARPFSSHVIIHVMEMTDMQTSGEKEAEDARRKAWAEVVAELQKMAVGAQTFELHFRQISLDQCELCAASLALALRDHTSRVLDGLQSLRTVVHQHIDSKELRDWLGKYGDEFWGLRMSESQGQRTVPVFSYRVGPSFSSDSEPLLLDRFHQAVSLSKWSLL